MRDQFKSFRHDGTWERLAPIKVAIHYPLSTGGRPAKRSISPGAYLIDLKQIHLLCILLCVSAGQPASDRLARWSFRILSILSFQLPFFGRGTAGHHFKSIPSRAKKKNCTRELDHFTDKLANGIFIFTYDPALHPLPRVVHLPHPLVIKNPDFEFRRVVFFGCLSLTLSLPISLSWLARLANIYVLEIACTNCCLIARPFSAGQHPPTRPRRNDGALWTGCSKNLKYKMN